MDEEKDKHSLYPEIMTDDEKINKLIDKTEQINSRINQDRITEIKNFLKELENHRIKYQKKKLKHRNIKESVLLLDLVAGITLNIVGAVLFPLTGGISTIMNVAGSGIIISAYFSTKILNKLENKNRNIENLSNRKHDQSLEFFKKAKEDKIIDDDEYDLFQEIRDEYNAAKLKIKSTYKKEFRSMLNEFNDVTITNIKKFQDIDEDKKTNSNILSDKEIQKMRKEIEKLSKNDLKKEIKKDFLEEKKNELKVSMGLI